MGGHAVDLRFYPKGRLDCSTNGSQEHLALIFVALPALEEHHKFVVFGAFDGEGSSVTGTSLSASFGGQFEILGPEIAPVDDEEILAPSGHTRLPARR